MILEEMRRQWDEQGIKYERILYSPGFKEQDIAHNTDKLYRLTAVETDNQLALVLMPAKHSIDFNQLKKQYQLKSAGSITPARLNEYMSSKILTKTALFAPIDIDTEDTINIHDVSLHDITRLSNKAIQETIDIKQADIFVGKQYRARIKRVSPECERNNLQTHNKCILGLSMENSNFEGGKMLSIIKWIDNNFEECEVFIGDGIHHHTLQMNYGIKEDEAKKRAALMAKEAAEKNSQLFKQHASQCIFTLVMASEIQALPLYREIRNYLWQLKDTNERFYQSVKNFAHCYVKRQDIDVMQFLPYSTNYLIDELAIFACMSHNGNKIFIYPGAMDIFHEISSCNFEDAPEALKTLINVELKFNTKGKQHKRIG